MTPERLHELEHCINQIADPVIAGWMGELWDALQAAEARTKKVETELMRMRDMYLARISAMAEDIQKRVEAFQNELKAAEERITELTTTVEAYRQWAEEARLKLSVAQAYLAMLGKHVIADDIQSFLTHPLPGEEDR